LNIYVTHATEGCGIQERPVRNSLVTLATIGLLLPACTLVRSDVTRFDQLPSSTAGATVVFLPLDDQKASAAYQTYTNRVAAELAKHGMDKSMILPKPTTQS
jgi:hypothetical protein